MQNGIPFSILIVDDDLDDLFMINEAFQAIGYAASVKKFQTGKALLTYLESVDASLYPSLIVLDNTLPELEASDVLSLLKNNTAYRAIPVVIYSTILSPLKVEQLKARGAYACIEKGNRLAEIVEVARQLKELAEKEKEDVQ